MALSPEERERLLAGLPEKIRRAVARRIEQVFEIEDWNDLVGAAEFNADLMPWVIQVQAGDREAFADLWKILAPRLRRVIGASLKFFGRDHFGDVESRVMTTLWDQRDQYTEDKGFYQAWAGTIARNLARWYKPGGARDVELDDDQPAPQETQFPPSVCFAEVLNLVQEERPHYALAFLFNRYLEWKPARIMAELGGVPFREVVKRVEEEVVSHFPILRGLGTILSPLRKRLQDSDATFFNLVPAEMTPEAAIGHWASGAARAVASRIVKQARQFLLLACKLRAASHERLAFLWCRMLSRTPARMALLRDRKLVDILDIFCAEFPPRTALAADLVERSAEPLRKEIIPGKLLGECEREELSLDIAGWRERVQAMLLGPARTEHLLAYAYLCGCLGGLTGPARPNQKK